MPTTAALSLCPGPSFPLLVPTDRSLLSWEGFITVDDARGATHQFWLKVSVPPEHHAQLSLTSATFTPGHELADLLRDVLPLLHRRLRCSDTTASFLTDVCAAVRAALDAGNSAIGGSGGTASTPRPVAAFAAIAAELASLPAGAVSDVSLSLDEVTLSFTDGSGRVHTLRVRLPDGYPDVPPLVLAHDLPSPLINAQDGALHIGGERAASSARQPAFSNVASILAALQRACDKHAALWAALSVIDAKCVVVDPPPGEGPPPWKTRSRRITLGTAAGGSGATLLVELPAAAGGKDSDDGIGRLVPVVRLSGPEPVISSLRPQLAAALASWTPITDNEALRTGSWLYDWLTLAVGNPLPARPAQGAAGADAMEAADDTSGLECGICYSVAQPNANAGQQTDAAAPVIVPDVWCDNPRCRRAFHTTCLADWLREAGGVGGGHRATFSRLYGECPYCKTQISVLAPADD